MIFDPWFGPGSRVGQAREALQPDLPTNGPAPATGTWPRVPASPRSPLGNRAHVGCGGKDHVHPDPHGFPTVSTWVRDSRGGG